MSTLVEESGTPTVEVFETTARETVEVVASVQTTEVHEVQGDTYTVEVEAVEHVTVEVEAPGQRGPEGPQGAPGVPGPVGDIDNDLPNLTLLFENGLY